MTIPRLRSDEADAQNGKVLWLFQRVVQAQPRGHRKRSRQQAQEAHAAAEVIGQTFRIAGSFLIKTDQAFESVPIRNSQKNCASDRTRNSGRRFLDVPASKNSRRRTIDSKIVSDRRA